MTLTSFIKKIVEILIGIDVIALLIVILMGLIKTISVFIEDINYDIEKGKKISNEKEI